MLPDTVLLEIFDFYMDEILAWQTLVHVCRYWRIIVFSSPRRLNLRLLFDRYDLWKRRPIREMLDPWPLFPIAVRPLDIGLLDDLAILLEMIDRICQLDLYSWVPSSRWEGVMEMMRHPFPALTSLKLTPFDELALVDPDSFLGGSAPRLQSLKLYHVPFPGIPKLLLSATHLVYLDLWSIPHSGYISPEAMVTCLSTLTKLETLEIGFEDPQSSPDPNSQRPLLHTHTHLPALTKFWFQGVREYVEDLVARIDAPLLNDLTVTFIHQLTFSSPELIQFIDRTPRLQAHDQARVVFEPDEEAWVTIPQTSGGKLRLQTTCSVSDQLLYLTQFCSSSIPRSLISAVEHLYIVEGGALRFGGGIENNPVQWVQLLRPFAAVKCLYISGEYTSHLILALQELVGERITEVLPNVQTLFFEESEETPSSGTVQEATLQFVAARQLVGQAISLSFWNGLKDA